MRVLNTVALAAASLAMCAMGATQATTQELAAILPKCAVRLLIVEQST